MRLLAFVAAALCLFVGVARAASADSLKPPFVRRWTYSTDYSLFIGAREGMIYCCGDGLFALSLQTGLPRWRCLQGTRVYDAVIQGGTIYAASYLDSSEKNQTASLFSIDASTGRVRTLASLPDPVASIATDSSRFYVADNTNHIRAYAEKSGRLLWSQQIEKPKSPSYPVTHLIATQDGVYVSICRVGEWGLEPASGRIRWSRADTQAPYDKPTVFSGDVITQDKTIRRVQMQTGKILWQVNGPSLPPAPLGNVIITASDLEIHGLDPRNGHLRWQHLLRDAGVASHVETDAAVLVDSECVWFARRPAFAVYPDGRRKWEFLAPFTGAPIYADSQRLITLAEHRRILCYTAGTPPPFPTTDSGRRTMADRLVHDFDSLDDTERAGLEHLKPYSLTRLLAQYASVLQEAAIHRTVRLFYLQQDLEQYIDRAFDIQNIPEIQGVLSSPETDSREHIILERLLTDHAYPPADISNSLAILRSPPSAGYSDALSAVEHSTDPAAVAFLIAALKSPTPDPFLCEAAFQHLAGTGGAAGVQAVRAARRTRRQTTPWYARLRIPNAGDENWLDLRTDAAGRIWLLFHSPILGDNNDLFIVQRLPGRKWGKPLFTGVWTEQKMVRTPPLTAYRGISISRLLAGDWIRVFPNDPALRRDTDGDGLTDQVETRLGTDPAKADTDGDGLPDLVDPCPNAAPRPRSDIEQIVAACVEARFFTEHMGIPAVLDVPGVKPFEFYANISTLIWAGSLRPMSLRGFFGGGVSYLGFTNPITQYPGAAEFVEFSPDHRTAQTIITRQSAGLSGDGTLVTLKKIDGEWFVVDMEGRWVS